MSFDYDSLQAGQIIWLYIIHGYVRTDASNIHTVALSTCKKHSFNFIQNCKIKRLLSTKWFLFYKVGKITLYLYSKVRKSIIIQYEPHCKPRSWLQKEWAFKKPFFCTSNVCLLPCDALFLRCIGVDGATFVGRSPVPFKSKRGQLIFAVSTCCKLRSCDLSLKVRTLEVSIHWLIGLFALIRVPMVVPLIVKCL